MRIFPKACVTVMIIFSALFITSCSFMRKAEKQKRRDDFSTKNLLQRVYANQVDYRYLSAKFSADLQVDGKTTGVKGTVRMLKDSVIWASVTPLFGLEFARVMATSDTVVILDRVRKKYSEQSLDQLKEVSGFDFDLGLLQSVLLGDLIFVPDDSDWYVKMDADNESCFLYPKEQAVKNTSAGVSLGDLSIEELGVNMEVLKIDRLIASIKDEQDGNYRILVNYSDYGEVDSRILPTKVVAILQSDSRNIMIKISLSSIKFPDKLTFPFNRPSSYEKR